MGEKNCRKGGGDTDMNRYKFRVLKKDVINKGGHSNANSPQLLEREFVPALRYADVEQQKSKISHPTSSQSADIVGLNVLRGLGEELPGLSWEL